MTRDSSYRLFPGVRFAHAISLGGNCEAAHGLRISGRHSINGLFDWLVTPLESIARILADDGARLGTDFAAVHEGTSVRCGAYGVLYHHEFLRDAENRVVFSAETIAACKAKLAHKMANFIGLQERGPLLFLRFDLETDLPWDRLRQDVVTPTAGDLDALAATLDQRFPQLDYRILALLPKAVQPVGFGAPKDPRIAIAKLPRDGNGGWTVSDAAWCQLLARIEFADEPASRTGRIDEVLHWFGDHVSDDARVPASAEPAGPIDKAVLEAALGRGDDQGAVEILSRLVASGLEPPDLAWQSGIALLRAGRSSRAAHALAIAFEHGFRNLPFIRDYLGLLTGETRYADVLRLVDLLRLEGLEEQHHLIGRHLAMLSGHAKLALEHPRDSEIDIAAAREASPAWLDTHALMNTIATAIRERRPFAFIRVGDGEARYLIAATHDGNCSIKAEEAHAMGDVCWENWFGKPLSTAGDAPRTTLLTAYKHALREADVIGACTSSRLRADTGHYGYLAWQENWLRGVLAERGALLWTDAQAHRHLNEQMPFLSTHLEGQDELGVISPHPGLAAALAGRLRIDRVIGYVVPAEGRLPTAAETRALGPHFPTIYEELLATLSVPRPGCVFLVAAGLLGKVYCARIKELGGIAIDIGALADAWMGFETRDGQNADVVKLETPPAPTTSALGTSQRATTYGCVSFSKTGSMAHTDAIRTAGFPKAVHLHYLGPRAIEIKRSAPEPMLDLAIQVASRISDPDHCFRLVTCVRDPIARLLSQAFYHARRVRDSTGVDIVRDRDAIIRWWESHQMARLDLWRVWFDDTFKTTFGFDFRAHSFNHERKSVRFSTDKMRLLVLRQGDDQARREAELGWLLDCESVTLRSINDAETQQYESAYRPFLRDFVAPSSWLDEYYETDVIRHYYTQAERDAFRTRWSGSRLSPVTLPDLRPRKLACLSMMKTGSTALAVALCNAGFGEIPQIHHLGPRSRGLKNLAGSPTDAFVKHLGDPANRFAMVTSVREPIARWISQAFHNDIEVLARTGRAIVDTPDTFIEWIEAKATKDYSSEWFDDSLKATFGFDYRDHPFDVGRRSIRFSSDRLRLLILRQEDPVSKRELELGWLVERDKVAISTENDSLVRFVDRYRSFLDSFVAPASWLDSFYETEFVRHFYTEPEREAFRARWSRPRVARTNGGVVASAPAAKSQPAACSTPAATAPPSEAETELESLKIRIRDGYVVDFNDYAYRPRERDWSTSRGAAVLRSRFDAATDEYAALLDRFCGFDDRFRRIPVLPNAKLPFWENHWLPGLDAVALYGLVAILKPRVFLEIGSGHSTRFVRRSISDNKLMTRIISIDPNPTAEIDALCDEVVRSRCEDVSTAIFARLDAGDMLFFDGSHRSFQNSDSTVFFTEILPTLAPGVIYGLHDVFLPYDYPESWLSRFYNEQYLLMAYLLGGGAGDEIVFPGHYVSRLRAFAPLRNRLFLGTKHLDWLVSSFWMRRAARSL